MQNNSIGNDIVDLKDWPDHHPRFIKRVMSKKEENEIANSHQKVALYWAAKEAAYKALKRLDLSLVFSPAKIEFDLEKSIITYKNFSLPCLYELTEDYVYVICATSQNILESKNFYTWISTISNELAKDKNFFNLDDDISIESAAVRILTMSKISEILKKSLISLQIAYQDQEQKNANILTLLSGRKNLIPYLKENGKVTEHILSFSHHGRYVMSNALLCE